MSWEYVCPLCGANLDPGEMCDCTEPGGDHEKIELYDINGQISLFDNESEV